MNKWFAYIVFSLILIPCLLVAKPHKGDKIAIVNKLVISVDSSQTLAADTTTKAKPPPDDKKKIKGISKARQVPKPEKVDDANADKSKKRQRRPPGMERPPEIPRHNGN